MSSRGMTETLPGWKIAGGIFNGVVMAPVVGLVVFFFLLSALPVVPLLAPLLLAFSSRDRRPGTPSAPALPWTRHVPAHGTAW